MAGSNSSETRGRVRPPLKTAGVVLLMIPVGAILGVVLCIPFESVAEFIFELDDRFGFLAAPGVLAGGLLFLFVCGPPLLVIGHVAAQSSSARVPWIAGATLMTVCSASMAATSVLVLPMYLPGTIDRESVLFVSLISFVVGQIFGLLSLALYAGLRLIGWRVTEQDGTLCQSCGYSAFIDDATRCPECGSHRPVKPVTTVVAWLGDVMWRHRLVVVASTVLAVCLIGLWGWTIERAFRQFDRTFSSAVDRTGQGRVGAWTLAPPLSFPFSDDRRGSNYELTRLRPLDEETAIAITISRWSGLTPLNMRIHLLERIDSPRTLNWTDHDPALRCVVPWRFQGRVLRDGIPADLIERLIEIRDVGWDHPDGTPVGGANEVHWSGRRAIVTIPWKRPTRAEPLRQ